VTISDFLESALFAAVFSHSVLERRPSRGKMAVSAAQSSSLKDAQYAKRVSQATNSFASTGNFGLSLAEQLKLSHHQANLLVHTWPKLQGNTATFAEVFK
jgi:hypothetical protein